MKHTLSLSTCAVCNGQACELPYKLQVDGLSLEEFWHVHSDWSQRTFGTDNDRGSLGPLKHLAKELLSELLPIPRSHVSKILESVKADYQPPHDVEEYADLVFLVFDACRRSGFTIEDLRVAVNQKMKKNASRSWPAPANPNEPVEHDRSGECD